MYTNIGNLNKSGLFMRIYKHFYTNFRFYIINMTIPILNQLLISLKI